MADQVRILGIAGSLRKASYNRGALRAAQQLLQNLLQKVRILKPAMKAAA